MNTISRGSGAILSEYEAIYAGGGNNGFPNILDCNPPMPVKRH